MNHEEAVIEIAIGISAIVFGLGHKGGFYALGPGQRPKPNTKTVPRWFGRIWFMGCGGVMIYWGVPSLRGAWHWSDLWADWWLFAFFGTVWLAKSLLHHVGTLQR